MILPSLLVDYQEQNGALKSHRVWCALTKKLTEHSLFLDDALRDACVVAKDLLMDGIRSHASMDKYSKDSLMVILQYNSQPVKSSKCTQ